MDLTHINNIDDLVKEGEEKAIEPGSREDWSSKMKAFIYEFEPMMKMAANASPPIGHNPDPEGGEDLSEQFQKSVYAVWETGKKLIDSILTYNPYADRE